MPSLHLPIYIVIQNKFGAHITERYHTTLSQFYSQCLIRHSLTLPFNTPSISYPHFTSTCPSLYLPLSYPNTFIYAKPVGYFPLTETYMHPYVHQYLLTYIPTCINAILTCIPTCINT